MSLVDYFDLTSAIKYVKPIKKEFIDVSKEYDNIDFDNLQLLNYKMGHINFCIFLCVFEYVNHHH